MRRFWGPLIFVLLICLVQTAGAQESAPLVVPDDFPTVEAAYAKVKARGIIALKPGKYALSRTLEIDKTVTFRGDAKAPEEVVIVCPDSDAFHITGGSPSFENLTVSGGAKDGVGFFIEGKEANPMVEKCIIKDCGGAGVVVMNEARGTFRDCDIYGNHSGIDVASSGNPTVTGCRIHDGKGTGIRIFVKGMGTFNKNTLSENYVDGKLSNWIIEGDTEMVKGTGNTPEIP